MPGEQHAQILNGSKLALLKNTCRAGRRLDYPAAFSNFRFWHTADKNVTLKVCWERKRTWPVPINHSNQLKWRLQKQCRFSVLINGEQVMVSLYTWAATVQSYDTGSNLVEIYHQNGSINIYFVDAKNKILSNHHLDFVNSYVKIQKII